MSSLATANNAAPVRNTDNANTLVDLNEVLQATLQQFHKQIRSNRVVLRCDALPAISGNQSQLQQLFNSLFRLVLHCLPGNNLGYLHISCQEDKAPATCSPVLTGTYYNIQFHTNVCIDKGKWRHAWKIKKDAEALIQNHKGTLKVYDSLQTGRLFSVSLPGKFT